MTLRDKVREMEPGCWNQEYSEVKPDNSCDFCTDISKLIREHGEYHPEPEIEIGGTGIIYDPETDEYDLWDECIDSFYSGISIRDINYCPKCGRNLKEAKNCEHENKLSHESPCVKCRDDIENGSQWEEKK